MQRDDSRPKGGSAADAGRAERLAAELRSNLLKRKARARKLAAGARSATGPQAALAVPSEAGQGPDEGGEAG